MKFTGRTTILCSFKLIGPCSWSRIIKSKPAELMISAFTGEGITDQVPITGIFF